MAWGGLGLKGHHSVDLKSIYDKHTVNCLCFCAITDFKSFEGYFNTNLQYSQVCIPNIINWIYNLLYLEWNILFTLTKKKLLHIILCVNPLGMRTNIYVTQNVTS